MLKRTAPQRPARLFRVTSGNRLAPAAFGILLLACGGPDGSAALADAAAGADAPAEVGVAPRHQPGPMHDRRYCEVIAVHVADGTTVGDVWNSVAFNDCPQAAWDALDAEAIRDELGASLVLLNGPRHFLVDSIALLTAPPEAEPRAFGDIEMGLAARVEIDLAAAAMRAYRETGVVRDTEFRFNAGAEIHELEAPDGAAYVMQSYSLAVDPALATAGLAGLSRRLMPPEGWRFRSRVLDKALVVWSDGLAVVVQDELENTYQRYVSAPAP